VIAQEAARRGDIIVVTIPLINIPDLPKGLFADVTPDVPVIDTSNYYPILRDGSITEQRWCASKFRKVQILRCESIFAKSFRCQTSTTRTAAITFRR
jgi:predicted dinucleotide-binding enzyme